MNTLLVYYVYNVALVKGIETETGGVIRGLVVVVASLEGIALDSMNN